MKRAITALALLLATFGCRKKPPAAPSAPAPVASTPANIWLERADRDIAVLPAETPKDLLVINPADLAIELCLAVPSDARRATALRLLDVRSIDFLAQDKSGEDAATNKIYTAENHARLGDLDGARSWLTKAVMPTTPTTGPADGSFFGLDDLGLAQTDLLLGDDQAFEKVPLKPFGEFLLGENLRADGRVDLARKAAALQQKKAWAEQPTEYSYPGLSRVDVIKSLVKNGETAAAIKLAAVIENDLSTFDNRPGVPGEYRFSAELEIAREAHRSGNAAVYRTAVTDAIDTMKQHQYESFAYKVDELLTLMGNAKDVKGIDQLFGAEASKFDAKEHGGPADKINVDRNLSAFASAYAKAGATTKYQSLIDRAEKALVSIKTTDLPTWDAATLIEEWAMDYLYIAAARAAAGDDGGVERNAAISIQVSGGKKTKFWDEPWFEVVDNLANAGRFDDAVAAMTNGKDDKQIGLETIVRARARAGQFDEAWGMAIKAEPVRERFILEYFLVVTQVQSGRTDGLADRVDAAETPQERAMMDVAAARAASGKPYMGNFRMFESRGD